VIAPFRFFRVIRSLLGGGPVDRDLDGEVASYLDLLIDEKIAAGASPGEARRQATLELGGAEQVKEHVRNGRPAAWLDHAVRDVRHGLRTLRKTPSFSLAAIVIVGLGIGANAGVFGLVNILLLQPPPGSEGRDRAVGIYSHDPKTPDSYRRFSYAEYRLVREQARSAFDEVMAHRNVRAVLSDVDGARRVEVGVTTADYFSALGARVAAGRSFTLEEERPGSEARVAVISDPLWQTMGGRRDVLGRTVLLGSRPFTIVGIAPSGFAGPTVLFGPQLWVPLGAEGLLTDTSGPSARPGDASRTRSFLLVGRLRDGITPEAAASEMRGIERRFAEDDPAESRHLVLTVHRLSRTEDGTNPGDDSGLFAPLGTLSGLAVILLIVASLNVANMQLARNAARRHEFAMRRALGAGRARLLQQLLIEALLIAFAGAACGLVFGVWTLHLLARSFAPMLEQATAIILAPDRRLVLATFGYALLSAAVFAVGPAIRLIGMDALHDLRGASRGAAGDHGRLGPRHLLVAAQVALSLALLAAAGLFVRAAVVAGSADPGYRLENQLLARLDASGLPEAQARASLERVMERVRRMPGVAAASSASLVAFGNESTGRLVQAAGTARDAAGRASSAVLAQDYVIGADYFKTLRLPLLRGREFSNSEEREPGSGRVAIIDEPLAERLFAGQDPIGRRLAFASSPQDAEGLEIVGVVPGLRHRLTDRGSVPHVYRPLGADFHARVNVHIRQAAVESADIAGILLEVRRTVRAADGQLAVLGVSKLEEARDTSPIGWLVRAAGQVFGALGGMSLAMAAAGLYGVKAYLVTRRRHEIGIRMALGATADTVVRLIVREGAVMLAVGVAVGLLLALGAGLVVSRLLVGVRPLDPVVLVTAASILGAAVLAASYIPARQATRVDPAVVLRDE
jgi:putative ABC transport system permease protein